MNNSLTFKDVIDLCSAQAIADKLQPTEESVHRYFARRYSHLFSTELEKVLEMDPIKVVLAVYEQKLDDEEKEDQVEKYLEVIYSIEDPNYQAKQDEELDEFIGQAVEEEHERIRQGKPIHPALKEEVSIPTPLPPNKPTSGFIDLSYLSAEEQ